MCNHLVHRLVVVVKSLPFYFSWVWLISDAASRLAANAVTSKLGHIGLELMRCVHGIFTVMIQPLGIPRGLIVPVPVRSTSYVDRQVGSQGVVMNL